jgi:single-strand DNA-binding protein
MNGIQMQAEARSEERREVSGTPVCNLSLAVTERKQNKQTGSWEDATTTWLRAAVWGAMASNVATSVMKGQLVNVTGILTERKYTTGEGAERSQLELRVDTISPSLRFARATVVPNERNGNGGGAPMAAPVAPAWQPGQPPAQAPWQGQQPAQQPWQGQQPAAAQQQQPVRTVGQPGPQPNQQWATPAYQSAEDIPF